MHNEKRWAPFNAVIDGDKAIKEILDRKSYIQKPILSEEMIEEIEREILTSYNEKTSITLKYYNNGKISETEGIITKLDPINKKITINSTFSLFFPSIIEILEKNT